MIVVEFRHDGYKRPFGSEGRLTAELPAVPSVGDAVWFPGNDNEFAVSSVAWTVGSAKVEVFLT